MIVVVCPFVSFLLFIAVTTITATTTTVTSITTIIKTIDVLAFQSQHHPPQPPLRPPTRRQYLPVNQPTPPHPQRPLFQSSTKTALWGVRRPDYYSYPNDDSNNEWEYDVYDTNSDNNSDSNYNNPYDSSSILDSTITTLQPPIPIPQQPQAQQRPIRRTTTSPSPPLNWSYDDDENMEESSSSSSSSLPGNFWMNPILEENDDDDDDSISPPPSRFSQELRRDRTQSQSPRASSSSSSNRRGRRTTTATSSSSSSTTTTSGRRGMMGNTQPSPPSPLLELYQRIFWYGLEDDDIRKNRNNNNNNDDDDDDDDTDDEGDRRSTMFGGTKGKFNGLAFLYDSIGTVPLQEQRPKRSSNQRNTQRRTTEEMDDDMYDNDDDYENDWDGYENESTFRRRIPPPQSQSQSTSRSSNFVVPVTPPYDPPIVPPTTSRNRMDDERMTGTPVPRSRRRRRASIVEQSELESDEPRRRRRSGSTSNGMNSNDWVIRTVDSWFSALNDNENDENDYLSKRSDNDYESDRSPASRVSSKRRGRRDNNNMKYYYDDEENDDDSQVDMASMAPGSTIIQPIAKAFETFLGLDRDVLQKEADTYNRQMGIRVSSTTEDPSVIPDVRRPQQRSYRANNDVDSNSDIDDMIDRTEEENQVKPLSWEERASAMERVPPIGVTAWGVDGVIDGCDARTKAFQDAMMDVQLVQEQIRHCQKQIMSLQDEMALLHMDIKLEKHQLHKLKQQSQNRNRDDEMSNVKKLTAQIRQMENQLNSVNYEIRYKQLQKSSMIRDYHVLVQRRHWAIFQTMKHVTMDEAILSEPTREAFYELEMNEPAVRRFSTKQREESQPP